ncbi:hypothetical protein [Paenibacillus hexagrammi]|uniref:Uncharacterized protein n=1 Tax=Paenibacillus hexagrammi TaxID=2908839 RepID=A0ABY3SIN3_9BACL|nr:hypothetical protein [Paenibacillus sp. YPD9-1]UJF33343.1 hypothetical protein L0M14_28170 [Paenibacillus sp. YPD9-1]
MSGRKAGEAMDWSRAKTILIVTFLTLNMILGFQLWTSSINKQTEIAADASGTVEELNRVLRSKNIRLTDNLPTELPNIQVINVKFDENMKPGVKKP